MEITTAEQYIITRIRDLEREVEFLKNHRDAIAKSSERYHSPAFRFVLRQGREDFIRTLLVCNTGDEDSSHGHIEWFAQCLKHHYKTLPPDLNAKDLYEALLPEIHDEYVKARIAAGLADNTEESDEDE